MLQHYFFIIIINITFADTDTVFCVLNCPVSLVKSFLMNIY